MVRLTSVPVPIGLEAVLDSRLDKAAIATARWARAMLPPMARMTRWIARAREAFARLDGEDRVALVLAVLTVVLAVVFLAMTPLSPSIHVHQDSRVEDVIAVRPSLIPVVSGALLITGMFTAGCAVMAWMISRTRRMRSGAQAAALIVTFHVLILVALWLSFPFMLAMPESDHSWAADDGTRMIEVKWGFTRYDYITFRVHGPFMVPAPDQAVSSR